MPDLILWNSIAKRRRSPSDTFLDNGLGLLKSALETDGFEVDVVDWARNAEWEAMTPRVLPRINRFLAGKLLASNSASNGRSRKASRYLAVPLLLASQALTSAGQKRSMENRLWHFAKVLRDSQTRVIGIKTWYGDAYVWARRLAGWARTLAPEVLIVAGGPHASIYREGLLEDGAFDVAVVGEGESALAGILALAKQTQTKAELLSRIAADASTGRLKNVIYRDKGAIRASVLSRPDANKKGIPKYDGMNGKIRIHVIVDSLGCPWGKCNFCVHPRIYPGLSLRSAEAVVDEIEQMVARGIGIFRFAGSSTPLSHARRIASLLEQRGVGIIFSMFARCEQSATDRQTYRLIIDSFRQLVRSGLRAVFVGAEVGDDSILSEVMHKGLVVEDIAATIKAMRQASFETGIPLDIGLSLIHPAPTAGKVSVEELEAANVRLVQQTCPDSVLVSPPAPFPGTVWHDQSGRFGFELGDDYDREMLIYDYELYKPSSLWPDVDVKLDGLGLREVLAACQGLRSRLESKGFVTEVTDEHFLMMRSAGYRGKEGAKEFKRRALLDLISCDYRWMRQMEVQVNRASEAQAFLKTR